MPIVPVQRIVSRTNNVTTAPTVAEAVALLSGGAANVVDVGNAAAGLYPQLAKFAGDNNPVFASSPDPQVLWSQPTFVPGERRAFATVSLPIPVLLALGLTANFIISMAVFSDNAVEARIQSFSNALLSLPIIPTPNVLNAPLTAGNIANPDASMTVDNAFPYNWQNIRFYTIPVNLSGIALLSSVSFLFTFDVLNYVSNGALNTAGLSFIIDIYQETLV
ncbi:hypothetical protein [Paenibacillus flagellatus]|uniref:Uncharacterized protein n=1 Tax=Paenibacillus flagellatus TaxID=2211139 RepID=A0A2V5JYY3_9BACL|nr:hypothetical protein [Paenibacillus flagellatus]PYI52129.1 hypothetical protein DLM86_21865 [Paenibacillus flagellatus]